MSRNDKKITRRELSGSERSRIADAFQCGVKQAVITDKLHIPTSTVRDTIQRLRGTGCEHPEAHIDLFKSLSDRDERALGRCVNSNRFSSLSVITNQLHVDIKSTYTIHAIRVYIRK